MNLFRMVYVFTPTILVCFPLIAPVFTRWLLSLLLYPTLAPEVQQHHDNQKSIYYSDHLGPTGEGLRHTDVLRLPR